MKSMTLLLKLKDAQRDGHIKLDEEAVPAPRVYCRGCSQSIPLDNAQQSEGEIVFRLNTFLRQHEACQEPRSKDTGLAHIDCHYSDLDAEGIHRIVRFCAQHKACRPKKEIQSL